MLKPVDYNSSNAVQFNAVYKIAKKNNLRANISYTLSKDFLSIKTAVKEILARNSESNLKPEINVILDKFRMSFDGGIKLLSILGVGSSINLFLADTSANKENLAIEVKTGNKLDGTYLIEGSNVIKKVGKKQKYLTQEEMTSSGVEKLLTSVADAIDLPILRLRQAQNPPPQPYVPQFPLEEIKETGVSNISKTDVINEKKIETKVEKPMVVEKAKINNERPSWLVDTSVEVDKLIAKLRKEAILRPTSLSKDYHSNRDIGKISARTKVLLLEVLDLFSQLDSIYEEKGAIIFDDLKDKLPSYKAYRKASTITFENLGTSSEGITFVRSCSKKHGGRDIYAIYKRNSAGEVTDVIPICDSKIYRMQKAFTLQDTSRFINMVSTSKCLSQKEVDSKNLSEVLLTLKNELTKAVGIVDPIPAEVSDEVKNLIEKLDLQYAKLSEKENLIKRDGKQLFQRLGSGGILIRNFNHLGDNLVYVNAKENKKMPGAVLIKINERGGGFKEGWLIKDGKVFRNYNGKNNYYPKEMRYFNSRELENMQFEEKALLCLESIKNVFELTDKILKSYS